MEMPGSGANGNGNGKNGSMDIIPRIVNTLNEHLGELNGIPDENLKELNRDEGIPITIAAPAWLTGGTPTSQGCPLTTPIPEEEDCSNSRINLPHLHHHLKSKKVAGVTLMIL